MNKIFSLSKYIVIITIALVSCKKIESEATQIDTNTLSNKIINNKDSLSLYKKIVKETVYKSNYDWNESVQKLDIEYKDLKFMIRYIGEAEASYLKIKRKDEELITWTPIMLNYYYDMSPEDAEKDIHILMKTDDLSKAFLLFPAISEEYRTYHLYEFSNNNLENLGIQVFESLEDSRNLTINLMYESQTKRLTSTFNGNKRDYKFIDDAYNINQFSKKSISNHIKLIEEQNQFNKSLNQKWYANYSSKFLRIKEENGDPRAYATLNIDIKKEVINFRLDSYEENLEKELLILNNTTNELILVDKNDKNSKFTITKSGEKIELKSDLLNKIMGEDETYKIEKIE